MIHKSYDIFPCKEVPFGGLVDVTISLELFQILQQTLAHWMNEWMKFVAKNNAINRTYNTMAFFVQQADSKEV